MASTGNALATDPEVLDDLREMRKANAYVARLLFALDDAELNEPSLLPGWTRRHLIAHLGYNARALQRLSTWANTGVETAMYPSSSYRTDEIERGATLPTHALRHLYDHSSVSLDVELRDTPDTAWKALVRTAQGREVPFSMVPWLRIRELWLHALDLNNGAQWRDIPEGIVQRLLEDITQTWSTRGLDMTVTLHTVTGETLASSDRENSAGTHVIVSGPMAGLLAWASGRVAPEEFTELSAYDADNSEVRDLPSAPQWI